MRIGSLFSGVGGLELGLERAGWGSVAWQAEIDPFCRGVLKTHWPNATQVQDVKEVTANALGPVDVICGGFPCQPASVAGKRRGTDDPRWLWPEFARIVREFRPKVVFAENVPGLRSAGMRVVLSDLSASGYDAEWATLAASDLGAPHLRKRLFIVATDPSSVTVRFKPGWLGRACRARALLARRYGKAWPPTDPNRLRELQPEGSFPHLRGWAGDSGWRQAPPSVRGVDDGVPRGLDGRRLKALGNAVCVQVAAFVGAVARQAVVWRET